MSTPEAGTPEAGTPGEKTSGEKSKTKFTDTELALDAIKKCVSPNKLLISETFPYIILFVLFYITTSRGYFLVSESKRIPCQENIRRGEYDDFISGFVYWVISFCIIIFIKFNNINLVNKFVMTTGELNTSLAGGRLKFVGQTLLTGFTSFLNIYFLFILLLTSYHIIDKIMNFIQCKSEVCTKYYLCEGKGDPSKAQYYNSGSETCYDSGFNDIGETGDEGEENSNSDPSFAGGGQAIGFSRGDPNQGRLISDFYPRWIMNLLYVNIQGFGLIFNITAILVMCGTYIKGGVEWSWFKYSFYMIVIVWIVWWGITFWSGIDDTGQIKSDQDLKKFIGIGELGTVTSGDLGMNFSQPDNWLTCENVECGSDGIVKGNQPWEWKKGGTCKDVPECQKQSKTNCTSGVCA